MNDDDFLKSILDNIKKGIDKLNNFEEDVMKRPKTKNRDLLIDAIANERKKLSDLAGSV